MMVHAASAVAGSGKSGNWPLLAAAFGANAIAYLGWYTLPSQWAILSGPLGLSQMATSAVVTAEVLTAAIVSIVMSVILGNRYPRVLLAVGVVLAVAGHAFAIFAPDFEGLFASRMIAGVGEGLLWVMLNAAIAVLDEPDRRFGQVNALTALILALVVAAIPYVGELPGNRPIFLALALLAVALSPILLPFLLHSGHVQTAEPRPSISTWSIWFLVIVVAIWSAALTMTFALSIPIGQRTGASEEALNGAIALSLLGIIAGAGFAGMVGTRFGRLRTLFILMVVEVVGTAFLVAYPNMLSFTISLLVVNFCVYSALPFILGLASELDRSGSGAAATAGGFVLGGGLSSFLGAFLLEHYATYFSIFWAIAGASGLCMVACRVTTTRNMAKQGD